MRSAPLNALRLMPTTFSTASRAAGHRVAPFSVVAFGELAEQCRGDLAGDQRRSKRRTAPEGEAAGACVLVADAR